MQIALRDYQKESISKVLDSFKNNEASGMLYLATGLGKTVIAGGLVSEFKPKKCLFICHREELAEQTAKKFLLFKESDIGFVMNKHNQINRKVLICSIQTLCSPKRLEQINQFEYDLVIVDECHHYYDKQWKDIILSIKSKYTLGLTATPNRSDNISAEQIFNKILYRYTILDGIKNKYLSDIKNIKYKLNADFSKLKIIDGDYSVSSLASIMTDYNIIIETYKAWEEYAKDRKTIVFCVNLEHVNKLKEYFHNKGISCESITGEVESETRRQIYSEFEKGSVQVLISCMVLTEGFDCLDTDTEILTENGWKNIESIKEEKNCYSYNLENNNIELTPILKTVERNLKHNEKMIRFENQHYNIRVTEGHNFFIKYRDNGKISNKWLEKSALELSERKSSFGLILSGNSINKEIDLTDNELKIIAWYLTDGYINKKGRFFIYQSKTSHYLDEIETLLNNLNWNFTKREKKSKTSFNRNSIMIEYGIPLGGAINIKRNGYKKLKKYFDKNLNRDLLKMSPEQFKVFWRELLKGDGCKSKLRSTDSHWLCTGNKIFIDNLQELSVRCGLATNFLKSKTPKGKDFYYIHSRDKKILFTQSHNTFKKDNKFIYTDSIGSENENENEKVWCVTNKNKTLITRRNGKVSIIGNCPAIECVLLARPTTSESLYIQMVGRGLRLYPNKTNCLVIDLVGNSQKHRIMQLGVLFGLDSEKMRKAKEEAKKKNLASDEEISSHDDWEQIESIHDFLFQKEDKNNKYENKFEWCETKFGLVLSLGYRVGFLLIQEQDKRFYKILHYYDKGWKSFKDVLSEELPLDWCINLAEKEAVRFLDSTKLIDRNELWRNNPISEKQKELLINLGYKGKFPTTTGDASKVISRLIIENKIENFDTLAINTETGRINIEKIKSLISLNKLNVKLGNKKPENLTVNESIKILLFNK